MMIPPVRSNPETLRTMMQMSAAMRGAGMGPGLGGGAPSFPAPGVPSNTASTGATNPTSPTATTQPGEAGTGAGAGLPNPALLQALMGANPFAGGLGGGFGGGFGGGLGAPGGGFGAFSAPSAPADTRPPEERFQVQLQVRGVAIPQHLLTLLSLQQLQDMGFSNAAQNVRALLATGGNVHAAIEYILGGGGL